MYFLNNDGRNAYDIANIGRQLARKEQCFCGNYITQYQFSIPRSVQGFQSISNNSKVTLQQGINDSSNTAALAIRSVGLTKAANLVDIMTQTFALLEEREMRLFD